MKQPGRCYLQVWPINHLPGHDLQLSIHCWRDADAEHDRQVSSLEKIFGRHGGDRPMATSGTGNWASVRALTITALLDTGRFTRATCPT